MYTTRVVVAPRISTNAASWPLRPTGNALVLVQEIVDGLNGAPAESVNVMGVLVPLLVWTTRLPVAAPLGTVVMMNVSPQSLGLAMVAAIVPPVPFENSTVPDTVVGVLPKPDPSIRMVLPVGPLGSVAPLTAVTTGGPDGPVGLLPPHPTRRIPIATDAQPRARISKLQSERPTRNALRRRNRERD